MIECDNNEEFIIANLSSAVINETLDLAFNDGEKICFKVDGPGTVHLTGNLMDEDNLSPTGEGFADMLEGIDSEEEEAGEKIQEVVEKSGKRKKVEAVKEVVAKKAKVDVEEDSEESEESGEEATTDADTTANATTGDDDDSDDSDDEDDSE